MPSNLEIVQAAYTAFGRGDQAALREAFAPDATIAYAGASPATPWQAQVTGHDALPGFLAALAEHVEFESSQVVATCSSGDHVALRLHLRYRIRSTGRVIEEDQVHWWTLRDGKVTEMTHFQDSAQVIAATKS